MLANSRRVLPYVDVPLQHASDRLLRDMKRGVTAERQRRLIEKLRASIPGLTLRTTFIVGFPGETDDDFEALCDFVREARFDRLGCFRYSDEAGTAAHALPNKVPRARRALAPQAPARAPARDPRRASSRAGRQRAGRAGRRERPARLAGAPRVASARDRRRRAAARACRAGELRRARITGVRGGVDLEAELIA